MLNSAKILTYSLSVLLVLSTVLRITDGIVIQPEYLNLTANMYSPCPSHIDTCPQTDDEKDGRLICMYGQSSCPSEDMYYFCDTDLRTNILVEDCFPLHKCAVGSKNAVRLDLKPTGSTVSLDCVQCSQYRVQRQPHDSSQRFTSECDDARMNIDFHNMLSTMNLVETRWPYGFDIYACDSTRGYSNKHRTSLCDISSFCSCILDIKCTDPDRPKLLPNGQCDAVCDKERDPFQDFSCQSYSAGLSTSNPTETNEHNESGRNSNIPHTNQSTTDKPQSKPNQDSSSFGPVGILFVCFGIVAVGVVVVVVSYCCCREKIQCLVKRARACVISKPDTDATEKLPEGEPLFDEIIEGRDSGASNGYNAKKTEANSRKQGKKIKIVNNETNKEKVEMHGKTITYNKIEIHHHPQPNEDTQQEQKLTDTQETNVDSGGHPEPAMQYYPSH